jgi:hypothetical protein
MVDIITFLNENRSKHKEDRIDRIDKLAIEQRTAR